MVFEGYNGRITIEGDELVVSREGVKGRFGGPTERRLQLDDVEGAFLQPPPEPGRPGYLQLVLVGEDEQEMTLAQAVRSPDVVTFSPRQQAAFQRLRDWLEDGGDLVEGEDGTDGAPAVGAAEPPSSPASAPPAGAPPVAAPPAAPASSSPTATLPGPGLVAAVTTALRRYADFRGRSRRSEYWWWVLANLLVGVVAGLVDLALGAQVLTGLLTLALLVPSLALAFRRLHDTGRSGAFLLLALVPFVGPVLVVVALVRDSEPRENAYGPSPKLSSATAG